MFLYVCMNICIEFSYDGIIVKSKKKEEKKYRRKERRLGRRDEGGEQEEIKREEVKNVTCEGHLEADIAFLQFKYFCN